MDVNVYKHNTNTDQMSHSNLNTQEYKVLIRKESNYKINLHANVCTYLIVLKDLLQCLHLK